MTIEEIEGKIDEAKQIKHTEISEKIYSMLEDDKLLDQFVKNYNMKKEFIDLCYSPVI